MKCYEKYGRKYWKDMENREENSDMIWKISKKVGWIVKWYGKYGRKASRIVIRYEKYGRKESWIVIRFGKYGR